jgi:hypothetical protein
VFKHSRACYSLRMHQRLPKKTPLQTIGYEIDMFRHCARTLADKKARFQKTAAHKDAAEYYLGLEGFLLHLRNLLAFLTNRGSKSTDLGINRPKDWAGRSVEKREYSDLMKSARALDGRYGAEGSTCYDQISKFLQHCTTHRHEQDRDWDVDQIFVALDPVLQDFEKRFMPKTAQDTAPVVSILRAAHNSTASIRVFSPTTLTGPFPE